MKNSPKIINPYNLFVGAFTPNWLLRRKEISQGAKLVYARLMQYGAKSGKIFPKRQLLAEEVGVSPRQLDRYLSELESLNLISSRQRGLTQSNQYYILEHPWMEIYKVDQSDDDSDSTHMSTLDSTHMSTQELPDMASQEMTDMSTHIVKDNLKDNFIGERVSSKKTPQENSFKKDEREIHPKSTSLSSDWQPSDQAINNLIVRTPFSLEELSQKAYRFKSYWLGEGKCKTNWEAAFEAWVLQDLERLNQKFSKETHKQEESIERITVSNDLQCPGDFRDFALDATKYDNSEISEAWCAFKTYHSRNGTSFTSFDNFFESWKTWIKNRTQMQNRDFIDNHQSSYGRSDHSRSQTSYGLSDNWKNFLPKIKKEGQN